MSKLFQLLTDSKVTGFENEIEKIINDLDCEQKIILKQEPCKDSCTMSKNSSSGNDIENSDADSKPCIRELSGIPENLNGDRKIRESTEETNNQVALITPKREKIQYSCRFPNDPAGVSMWKPNANTLGGCSGGNDFGEGKSQFVRPQRQVFVFSTLIANTGSKAVLRGDFPSIVAYYSAQLQRKMSLEKDEIMRNRAGHLRAWSNNFNAPMYDQNNQETCGNSSTYQIQELTDQNPNHSPFRNEPSANNFQNLNSENSFGNTESSIDHTINNVVSSLPSPYSITDSVNSSPNWPQPSLRGVKAPNEVLILRQRIYREAQLAILRRAQAIIFNKCKKVTDRPAQVSAQSTQSQPFRHSDKNSPSDRPVDELAANTEWDDIKSQLFDLDNKVSADNSSPVTLSDRSLTAGSTGQGPSPPHHRPKRPSSPLIALLGSTPSFSNNRTSNLSLSSLPANSGENSSVHKSRHVHCVRQRSGLLPPESRITQESPSCGAGNAPPRIDRSLNHSNSETPVSYPHLLGFTPDPPSMQKHPIDLISRHSPSVDDILCQTLEAVSREQREQVGTATDTKDGNLMPVPRLQQELTETITRSKDTNSSSNTGQIRKLPDVGSNQCSPSGMGVTSPLSEINDRGFGGLLPSPRSPRTPRTPTNNTGYRVSDFSTTIQAGSGNTSSSQNSPAAPHDKGLIDCMGRPKKSSPSSNKRQPKNLKTLLQSTPLDSSGSCRDHVLISEQHENLPLNPNNVDDCHLGTPESVSTDHFDPITSLAQMSELLPKSTLMSNLREMCSENPFRKPVRKRPPCPVNPKKNADVPRSEREHGDSTKSADCVPTGDNPASAAEPAGNSEIPNIASAKQAMESAAMHTASTSNGEPQGVIRLAEPSMQLPAANL
ncbi:protein BCL9 homolog [Neodiprion virginianus]|uniref:protein BCL9 homolog n=1 Tax=Neodiprion virginianus TaxID=2961670 RepID=UPI001EE765CB|nr:protein BCL9 homolog [Neodiprion virginianus]